MKRETYDEIVSLLKNTTLSYEDIASELDIDIRLVYEVIADESYFVNDADDDYDPDFEFDHDDMYDVDSAFGSIGWGTDEYYGSYDEY